MEVKSILKKILPYKIINFLKIFVPKTPKVGTNNLKFRKTWLEKTLAKIPKKSKILDAGAGTQRYKKFCNHLNYVSQDFAKYNGLGDGTGMQKEGFEYGKLDIISDITSIPEPDDSFDAIMCVEVLEHLPNPVLAIKEFSRLLKPKGKLVLTAPFCSSSHYSPYHFSSGFNKYWYEEHLKNDFDIIDLKANGNFFEFIAQEINKIPSVSSEYCNKKPNFLENIAMYFVKKMLLKFSLNDTKSFELACFGYNIFAVKK